MLRKKLVVVCLFAVVVVGLAAYLLLHKADAPIITPIINKATGQNHTAQPSKPAVFDSKKYSIDDPASPWIVVNKLRPLNPKPYAPNDLVVPNIPLRSNITNTEKYVRKETAAALEKMVVDANNAGIHLNLQSGYRSYDFQVTLYNRYVQQQGQAAADTQSARPGYSEHQTGWAADLGGTSNPSCNVEACYGQTTEGKWLASHAYLYGFIIRYPDGKQNITGYIYEPWHVRYIGTDLATEMHTRNIQTLEEFFNLPAAPDYN
jgi:D-alanyl-D-alanine carboxypeptidase